MHRQHSDQLTARGVRVIDLTPAAIGPLCVPPVNLEEHLGSNAMNVNMITCGGQATIPMVYAVSRVQAVAYGEIVATVSSRSVGPGTRRNIDEFTRTTAGAIEQVGGARQGKAIIIINPAEPPLIMRDTIHCLTEDEPDGGAITASVHDMIAEVRQYVPGYTLKNGPVFDGKRVSIFMEVAGLGDYLPKYAGNLDIMTAVAVRTASESAPPCYAARCPPWPLPHKEPDMNQRIAEHDMTLRDGIHPKRHQISLDQMKTARGLDDAGVPLIEVTHGDGLGGASVNYGFPAHSDEDYLRAVLGELKQA